MGKKDLDNRFMHHPPSDDAALRHNAVRKDTRLLAGKYDRQLPEGREKALALTKLEEAMFWANAAIARSNADQ